MRKLLFSKSFFGLLACVLLLDMAADVLEQVHPQHYMMLNNAALVLDAVALVLVLAMVFDLSRRRPSDGGHPRSR